MNKLFNVKVLAVLFPAILLLTACPSGENASGEGGEVVSKRAGINEVIIHELADPDMIFPINSTSANSTYIEGNVFMTMLGTDPTTYETFPLLAKERPTITPMGEGDRFPGGMTLPFEIREEAVWDDGTPVTGHDYLFTIKTILNPKTDCEPLKPYFDFIGDIEIDPENPKKFTVYAKTTYMLVESFSGYWVMPEYIYDPEKIMRGFDVKDLNSREKREAMKGNAEIIRFAEHFNSEKFQREKGFVVGCGPYEFEKWTTGQSISLKRKANWWGDQLKDLPGFNANPDRIIYQIINDWTTAVTAMKDEGVDLMRSIETKNFSELQKNDDFKKLYEIHTPTMFSYYYLGLNTKNPKLSDVRVRKAIAHAVNKKQIIDGIMYGMAEPTASMVHPKKRHYNNNIKPYDFDLDKAKALLDEAGWVDSDGDGFRDKMIDGVLTKFELVYKYNSGNEIRKSIGLLFQQDAKKLGIDVQIVAKEWTVYLDELDSHDFEVSCAAWVGSATMSDPKQIWHTESSVIGGSNYVSFGDQKSDALIDELRMEYDYDRRVELYQEFQQMVHDNCPYVFLFTPTERIAIHNRFEAETYSVRPGYDEKEFVLKTATKAVASAQ